MAEEVTICSLSCFLALPLTFVPSVLWLLFFMRHKKHRENPYNIIGVFLWGITMSLPVIVVGRAIQYIFFVPILYYALAGLMFSFLAVALVEEVAKYLAVKYKAMPYKFFDDAQDAIIYMVTAALGFAAIENFIYALALSADAGDVLQITFFRGISATFLHAIASGTIGYFLALSLENRAERKKFLYTGIAVGTMLHGIYNNFIIDIQEQVLVAGGLFNVAIVATFLIISGIIITIALNRLAGIQFARK
jgi:RsiW-degrading membrane proteinase PrsW (M82 family)